MTFSSFDSLMRRFCVAAFALLIAVALSPVSVSAQTNQPYDAAGAAAVSVRLSTLEDQVRQLNGYIEQMNFQIRELQDQLRRVSEDTEYRFQEMGQGGGSRSSVSIQPQGQQLGQPLGQQSGQQQGLYQQQLPPQGQTLGQAPGQPMDLSSALGQPIPDPVFTQLPPLDGSGLGGQGLAGQGLGVQGQSVQGQGGQLTAPQSTGTLTGAQPNQQLVLAPSGDPKDIYDLSYGYILRGEFDVAEASFRQFLTQYPNDPLAGNAQYWLGESLFARALYRDAADAFLKGYSVYPDSAKAPDSLYKLGMSLKELGQADAACSTFSEISRRYPKAPQAVQERTRSEMQKSGC